MANQKEQSVSNESSASTPELSGTSLLKPQLLQRLYYYMLKCRMTEERARLLLRKRRSAVDGRFGPGREATGVGAAIDLLPEDTLGLSPGNPVVQLVKGTPLEVLYAQIYARNPAANHRSPSALPGYAPLHVVLPSSNAAVQLTLCTGMALAYKLQKKSNLVVTLTDAAFAPLEMWHEALNCAGAEKLPIVYVVENRMDADHGSPASAAAPQELRLKAEACGVPGITVDANDVVAVYRVCHEARERARQGYGPTLVECMTYDYGDRHNHGKAKHRSVPQRSSPSDPIATMERYLHRRQLWDEQWKQQIIGEISREIEEALKLAEQR